MKKVMDVTEEVKKIYSTSGFLYITAGIAASIRALLNSDTVFLIIEAICLVVILTMMKKVVKAEKRISDEMSERNLFRAKSLTFEGVRIFLMSCLAIIYVMGALGFEVKLSCDLEDIFLPALFFMIGISSAAVGYLFKKYEEE